jgi:diguanylate cyclase (GGDEF)-like protein
VADRRVKQPGSPAESEDVGRARALVANLEPYDPVVARRAAAGVLATFALIDFVGTLVAPLGPWMTLLIGFVNPGILLAWAAVMLRGRWRWIDRAMVVNPLLATVLICVLDLVTRDATPGGQIAFCAPVLYAASQLRITAAVVVLVATIGAELLTVLMLKPLGQALTDAAYVSIILVVITVLLTAAGIRQDRLLKRLQRLAAVDPLTGLVTRRVFDEAALNALRQTSCSGIALVLADIDRFKSVNDTYGHPVGDDALSHVADVFRGQVGSDGVLCRLGGDEIAVLLPGADGDTALALAERLVMAVRGAPLRHAGKELPLSVSTGVAYAAEPGLLLRQLYAAADASLYDAKRCGRDRAGRPVDAAAAALMGGADLASGTDMAGTAALAAEPPAPVTQDREHADR